MGCMVRRAKPAVDDAIYIDVVFGAGALKWALQKSRHGMQVADVGIGGQADTLGVHPGDVLVALQDVSVKPEDWTDASALRKYVQETLQGGSRPLKVRLRRRPEDAKAAADRAAEAAERAKFREKFPDRTGGQAPVKRSILKVHGQGKGDASSSYATQSISTTANDAGAAPIKQTRLRLSLTRASIEDDSHQLPSLGNGVSSGDEDAHPEEHPSPNTSCMSTMLKLGATRGDVKMVHNAIHHGGDPSFSEFEYKGVGGNDALHLLCFRMVEDWKVASAVTTPECVEFLLEGKVDPDATNSEGYRPIDLLRCHSFNSRDPGRSNDLQSCKAVQGIDKVIELLESRTTE